MIEGLIIMGGLGLLAGAGLAIASKVFYVYVDPKIEEVEMALPGANCGGCGYAGCAASAAAMVAGKAPPNACVAASKEVIATIARILGVAVTEKEPDLARVNCTYGVKEADLKHIYGGLEDCRAASLLSGGSKVCPIGCLGLGTCVRECPFGALSMGPDQLPVVNKEKCTGCGTCTRVCPRGIITLTSNSRRVQHEWVLTECSTPCQRACPAGIDIPQYIRLISQRKYLDAVQTIKERNPFPLVCGRICVHPCEYVCRRNLVDEAVAINPLKRFVADYEMRSGMRIQIPRAPSTGHKLAVIGGGAEGLTCAYFLNRLGNEVVVYEAKPFLGGLLRYGIPQNRLPKEVLDWEIQGILDAGVEAQTSKALGKDITVHGLLSQGYKAVAIAIGGWDSLLSTRLFLGDLQSPLPGIGLLTQFMLSHKEGKASLPGNHVVILEGGKLGLEAAMALSSMGAQSVTVIYRSLQDEIRELPVYKEAMEKGIKVLDKTVVLRLTGNEDKLNQLEVRSGGEAFVMEADCLLIATGRFPELVYVPMPGDERYRGWWSTIYPYPSPKAEEGYGLFRPGEAVVDYRAVVEAIGQGRRLATTIQKYITGEAVEPPPFMITKDTLVLDAKELVPINKSQREIMPVRPVADQINNPDLEIELGFTEEQALKEAKRCLQCGLICYRKVA